MEKGEQKRKNKGFTLVELIVVMAIMTILATAIALAVIRYIEKGRIAMDVYNAGLIKDALNVYPFPSDFQGRVVNYEDPETGETESYKRGWVYVDKDEIRCSDQSCAIAMIQAGLVHVSPETEQALIDNEESSVRWFPSGPDGDYVRRSGIDEYVFKNALTVKAKTTWNTYQLDVYVDGDGEIHLGGSASNAIRVGGHAKDSRTARLFSSKVGLEGAWDTPIGEQYNGN
ncbi:MAG: type II secretion system GspH family protein [Eubacterium sp.]|nr:type II secretion system GspH family protein [Eubacterium sp.]